MAEEMDLDAKLNTSLDDLASKSRPSRGGGGSRKGGRSRGGGGGGEHEGGRGQKRERNPEHANGERTGRGQRPWHLVSTTDGLLCCARYFPA